jgi:hypothetical protein
LPSRSGDALLLSSSFAVRWTAWSHPLHSVLSCLLLRTLVDPSPTADRYISLFHGNSNGLARPPIPVGRTLPTRVASAERRRVHARPLGSARTPLQLRERLRAVWGAARSESDAEAAPGIPPRPAVVKVHAARRLPSRGRLRRLPRCGWAASRWQSAATLARAAPLARLEREVLFTRPGVPVRLPSAG